MEQEHRRVTKVEPPSKTKMHSKEFDIDYSNSNRHFNSNGEFQELLDIEMDKLTPKDNTAFKNAVLKQEKKEDEELEEMLDDSLTLEEQMGLMNYNRRRF